MKKIESCIGNIRCRHFERSGEMGLCVSHDAWHGAYSSFNQFRRVVAEACGVTWPDKAAPVMTVYMNDFSVTDHPGLFAFFTHSDCDGEIDHETCAKLADEMEGCLPFLDANDSAKGHLAILGYGGAARKFIAGCRKAANAKEPLVFS